VKCLGIVVSTTIISIQLESVAEIFTQRSNLLRKCVLHFQTAVGGWQRRREALTKKRSISTVKVECQGGSSCYTVHRAPPSAAPQPSNSQPNYT